MNPIDEQKSILEKLAQIVYDSAPIDSDYASCDFEYDCCEDGSYSVCQTFFYYKDDLPISAALKKELCHPAMYLVKDLHYLMKKHTGGDWISFKLTVGPNDKVTTKFEYPKQE